MSATEEDNFDRKNYSFVHRDWNRYPPLNYPEKILYGLVRVFVRPVQYFRENIIEPNQKTYYWYHRKYPRVPTIDQCYEHDVLCHFEAEQQLIRDKKVDNYILQTIYERFNECVLYEGQEAKERCQPLEDLFKEHETNWFIKYGDVGAGPCYARMIFMKQKHRMLWERRHGPVGTGKKEKYYHADGTPYYE